MKFALMSLLAGGLLFFQACGPTESDPKLYPAPEAPAPSGTTRLFERLSPERSGISFVPQIQDEHRYNFMADPYIYNGGGVAVLDVNNDGLQDLFFTNRLQGCRLYLNKGGLRFEDISESSGVAKFSGLKTGATVVDINGDGRQDIYVCRTWLEPLPDRRNLLFVNNKNGGFSEEAAAYGLDDISASQHAVFFDYDLDGDLDCYIVNHPVDFKTMNNLDAPGTDARRQSPKNEWESDRLMENRNGHFEDVTARAGMLNRAYGLSCVVSDFNDDGRPDLFVGNDFVMPDFLYINNGQGGFTDQGDRYFRHSSNHTMGADYADLNNDGWSDLITLDMLAPALPRRQQLMNTMQLTRDQQMRQKGYGRQAMRNALQLNNGRGGFNEIACLAGVFATDWSWAPLIADLDNDGLRDVFISNGIQRDLNDLDFFVYTADSINRSGGINKGRFPNFNDFVSLMPSHGVHNCVFQNTADLALHDVSEAWGFTQTGFSNGAAYSDLDNDGDLDLITNNLQAPPSIYENKAAGATKNNWLQIKCKGPLQNPDGLGAKIRVYGAAEDGKTPRLLFSQEIQRVRGFYSSVEPILQIGLGSNTKAALVQVDWLDNRCQEIRDVSANQRIILNHSDAKSGKCPALKTPSSIGFERVESGIDFVHRENPFEDFDREKLLPYRLSTQGPCLAAGDINGDGLDDVFIGGAAGQPGAVYLQQKGGRFAAAEQPALAADKDFEDTGCALFDVEGDGDLDLVVVSGGNEAPEGSGLYQDRLYLNDGAGHFTAAKDALPKETAAGSCIALCDFNQDGKTDLLIGGRAVPGKFPNPAESMVLQNEGGKFKKVTAEIAPELQNIGMVTDIQTGDLDGDGRSEWVVFGDWMPITVLQWNGKQYTNNTPDFDLAGSNGLWRSGALADLDGDGDLDIAGGNIGLNTRFHARATAPLRLYANDFDHNGSIDAVPAMAEGGHYYPAFTRDILASQMPFIKKKFPRYAAFAAADIVDLFSKKELLGGLILSAYTLKTQWFENEKGRFQAHDLPEMAQVSSTEKILVDDVDSDGKIDLLVLGNEYGMDIETYQLDASDGYCFKGQGKGQFGKAPQLLGVDGMVRDAVLLRSEKGEKWLLCATNNASLQVLRLRSSMN